ncbi:MAG: Hsp33 family molecular chaperone HslO [Bdellovibrionota bacterium]
MSSRWIKCISTQGNIRGVALQATDLVQQMVDLHGLKGIYARGLGESVMGALLVASYCRSGQRINLNIQGSGFYQQALVDAYPNGTVRGYVIERNAELVPERPSGEEAVGPWGNGLLSLLRTKDEEGQRPYIGTVPLLTGHLAKDLSFYWVQSEQIPSAVGLAVNIEDGKVTSAGGFLVQALPGASPLEVQTIEQHVQEIDSLASAVAQDGDPLHLLSRIFQSTAFVIVEEKPLTMHCNCSWERVQRALALVGIAELQAILAEDHKATVRCDFCTKEYLVDSQELQRLIDLTSGKEA